MPSNSGTYTWNPTAGTDEKKTLQNTEKPKNNERWKLNQTENTPNSTLEPLQKEVPDQPEPNKEIPVGMVWLTSIKKKNIN